MFYSSNIQLFFLFEPAMRLAVPEAVDFAYVTGGGERLDVLGTDEVHNVGELVLGKQGLDLNANLPAVSALYLVKAASAM